MLQDKLPQLIRLTYNIKIVVAATYKAKQTLAAKGLTPAIFLDRFYRQKVQSQAPQQISYSFKQKQMRSLPQFITIDIDDYTLLRKQEKDPNQDIDEQLLNKKILEYLNQQKLKYLRETDKSIFNDRARIQKFLNNQSFHWFQQSNKIFYHGLSLGQQNYRVNTSDQPMGISFIVQVQKQKTAKQVFDKVKTQIDLLMRKIFQLNPQQQKNVSLMMVVLYNVSQSCTIQQALQYSSYFKQNTNIHSSLIYRLAINGQDLHDSVEWSRFNRPILHFKYNLKSSDPVRIIAYEQIAKLQEIVSYHKETIRKNLQKKLTDLIKKHQQVNKATTIIASFFRGNTPNDKSYTKQQFQLRQLADKMFVLEDYKRAYDIYKNLAGKLEKRNPNIENNLSEMIQLCLVMGKFHNIKLKSDPYNEIQKYSQKIFKFYEPRSKLRLKKYLIFLVYVFHTFRQFDRQFIRIRFYSNLKSTFSTNLILNVVSILIYEQFANMNLFFPNIDYRRYCYDLTRVASRFSQTKMTNYALRCYLIVEAIYRDTFTNIEKYQYTQLGYLFYETKNYRQSLKYLKNTWDIYISRMQSEDLQKNQNQIIKQVQNFNKMIKQIEKSASQELQEVMGPNLQIPIIHALNMQIKDQMLQFDQKSGTKWQQIGQIILDSKQLMSAGLNQRQFRKMFKSFDYGVPEQKCLIHRFNSSQFGLAVKKKNSRNAYVGQPIKLAFYMRNPLRIDIEIQDILIKFKNSSPNLKIESQFNSVTIKSFKSAQINFIVTPTQAGYLQLQKLEWIFMKLLTQYSIKQPEQIKSNIKTCYFKVNIHPAVGCLSAKAHFQDYYYQGQKGKMKIKFTNDGVQQVSKIYMASQQMFTNRLHEITQIIKSQQTKQFQFDISIPLVHSNIQSGQQKKICKLLILYKTGDRFRVCRTLNKFNILRIAKLQNILCERLSTHLYLLSFSKKKSSNKDDANALQWMIIPGGYDIVKEEAAELATHTNYFFFIRKGTQGMAKYQFQNWTKEISSYPQQFVNINEPSQQHPNTLNIRFLWHKQGKTGYIQKLHIPIVINQHGYLSPTYPINFKINYQKQITHNFSKVPYLQIPISIKLKNMLYNDQLKVNINFIQRTESDSSWQGITQRKLSLKLSSQAKFTIKYIVVRPGIYNLSNQIKYSISNSKLEVVTFIHAEYEQIYLTVKNQSNSGIMYNSSTITNSSKIDFEDAFKQFKELVATKSHSNQVKVESQSLI